MKYKKIDEIQHPTAFRLFAGKSGTRPLVYLRKLFLVIELLNFQPADNLTLTLH